MMQTIQDRLCDGLICLGMAEIKKTTKYRRFVSGNTHYFVGKAGALRVSRTGNLADTVRCSDAYREKVLNAVSMESPQCLSQCKD